MAMKNIQVWQLPVCWLPCSSERLQKSWGSSVFGSPYGGKQKLNKNLASLAALVGVIKNKGKKSAFLAALMEENKNKDKAKTGTKILRLWQPWLSLSLVFQLKKFQPIDMQTLKGEISLMKMSNTQQESNMNILLNLDKICWILNSLCTQPCIWNYFGNTCIWHSC